MTNANFMCTIKYKEGPQYNLGIKTKDRELHLLILLKAAARTISKLGSMDIGRAES